MYERSAIVLERYLNDVFEFNRKNNLKQSLKNYKDIVEKMEKYQMVVTEEEKVIAEFDEIAIGIQNIQKEQSKLFESNIELEKQRNQLFNNFDEKPENVQRKLEKIEDKIENNNNILKELKDKFVEGLAEFGKREKERNKWSKNRRLIESEHIEFLEKANQETEETNQEIIKKLKTFIELENNELEQNLNQVMIANGKDERVGFDKTVIEKAINTRISIVKKEAEIYVLIHDRTKKILVEISNDNLKLTKYQKVLKDVIVKLAVLEAEKRYIVSFLDNERLTAINGPKLHKKKMKEACENFDLDIIQIDNLYKLILLETTKKATKKAYSNLYNKTYLRMIEEKEKNFEKEVNNIKINAGTIINSNYWRIQEIKNIYEVFQKEVSEKYEKDLQEFRLEEPQEELEIEDEFDDEIEGEEKLKEKQREQRKTKKSKTEDLEELLKIEEESLEIFEDENEDYEDEEEYDDDEDYEEDYEEEYDEDENEDEDEEHNENEIVIERAKGKKDKSNKKTSKNFFNKIFKEKNNKK